VAGGVCVRAARTAHSTHKPRATERTLAGAGAASRCPQTLTAETIKYNDSEHRRASFKRPDVLEAACRPF
jgi:hypothetical protein